MACRHCNRWGNSDCGIVVCMGCGTPVCSGHGIARAQCPVCLYGRLPGWSIGFGSRTCGYKGCQNEVAFLSVPRIGTCCLECASRPKVMAYGGRVSLAEYVERRVKENRLRFIRPDSDMFRKMVAGAQSQGVTSG